MININGYRVILNGVCYCYKSCEKEEFLYFLLKRFMYLKLILLKIKVGGNFFEYIYV